MENEAVDMDLLHNLQVKDPAASADSVDNELPAVLELHQIREPAVLGMIGLRGSLRSV